MFARICTSPSMCCRLKHLDSQVDPKDSIRSNNRGRDIDSKNQKGYSVLDDIFYRCVKHHSRHLYLSNSNF